MVIHQLALTSISDFFLSSEVVTMQQTDGVAYKLKLRSFHKSTHLWAHFVDFHPGVNCTWQYYQTPKSAVTSEQFCLLKPLLQFYLQFNLYLILQKSKWLPLTITLQLQSHYLGHPSIQSCVWVTRWLIHCCSNHSSLKDKWSHNEQSSPVGLSSNKWGNYKRTQQGALAVLLLYLYKLHVVRATTISNRP